MDTNTTKSAGRRLATVGAALVLAAGSTVAGATPAAAYTPAMTFAGVADYDRDGSKDIVARDGAGKLWLYPGQSTRGYSSLGRFEIGNGWNAMTFAGVADYDRDGRQDIVARDN
ncbi:FG-GAP repeat domain-containing protein, partial [Actinoplanes sp. NPDC049599]|uniref:FG-GAP repeat domain-containing protein n=1 Tax=Actinoplanes sp. NPDC049599 TaxID=3363903 RepID=UPI0037903469